MKLGIVGHAADKFSPESEERARGFIMANILVHRATCVISGGCHLGGVDKWAEEEARRLNVPVVVHKPEVLQWNPLNGYGYKARNLQIAEESDMVLVVVARDYLPGYKGMRFRGCYHCRDRNPVHVKSGGCWTAWKCKKQKWEIL